MLSNRFAPTTGFVMAPVEEGRIERSTAGSSKVAPASTARSADVHLSAAAAVTGGAAMDSSRQDMPTSAHEVAPPGGRGQAASDATRRDAAPSADPVGGRFPETWRHDMAAGDKSFLKTLDRFDSPAALARAYRELTTKLSSGELKATKPLDENATSDQVAAWRADHGLPESVAAYVNSLRLPDGMIAGAADQPLLASFAEQAMNANLTAEQYNQAIGWYFATQERLLAERQRADAEFKAQSSASLVQEWGADYVLNRNMVAQFFDRNFPQQFNSEMLNARLPDGRMLANDPAFNRAILELAKFVNPPSSLLPNASGAGLSGVEGRIAEIENTYMRAAHGSDSWKSYWTGESGARMQQEYRSLLGAREQSRRDRGR
jgi:hypothetical protein